MTDWTTVKFINALTHNDPYRGHTAPLTSKVAFYIFIKKIQVTPKKCIHTLTKENSTLYNRLL